MSCAAAPIARFTALGSVAFARPDERPGRDSRMTWANVARPELFRHLVICTTHLGVCGCAVGQSRPQAMASALGVALPRACSRSSTAIRAALRTIVTALTSSGPGESHCFRTSKRSKQRSQRAPMAWSIASVGCTSARISWSRDAMANRLVSACAIRAVRISSRSEAT